MSEQPGGIVSARRYPLYFAQEVFLRRQFTKLHVTLRFPSDIPVSVLVDAVREIVRRHEPLRMRLAEDDIPTQIFVDPRTSIEIEIVKVSNDSDVHGMVVENHEMDLDLANYGPLRATCFVAPTATTLAITVHHIAADDRSLNLIGQELAEFVSATVRGAEPEFDELAISYSQWLESQISAASSNGTDDFWTREFADLAPIRLPIAAPLESDYRISNGPVLSEALANQAREITKARAISMGALLTTATILAVGTEFDVDNFSFGTSSTTVAKKQKG